MPRRVLIPRAIPQAGLDLLSGFEVRILSDPGPPSREEMLKAVADVDAILTTPTEPIDAPIMDAAGERLKLVANMAVGYDNIDLSAAAQRGITVTNTPGVLDETTADFAFALLLAAARRMGEGERLIRAGRWSSWGPKEFLGPDVWGKTLGIVGMGRIGLATARRAKGFGMEVLYAARNPRPEAERELGACRMGLDELLGSSDFVSLHTPLTPQTRHLIGERELSLMKPTAVLVNTARGPVVDEAALAAALAGERIFAAGLDVFEREPEVHPGLLELENVVLAPHIASASFETRDRMASLAARNVVAVLGGEPPITPVEY